MRLTLVFLALLISNSSIAQGCNKSKLSPPEAFKEADIVFRGNIENLQYLDNPERTKTEPRIIVTFSVSKVWKGTADEVLTIHTTYNKSTCNGYAFKAGKEYLVYSRYNRRKNNFLAKLFSPDNPKLGVKVYAGTKLITDANEDIKYLEK